jgi:hypothetical protein
MYERFNEPLLPFERFILRLLWHSMFAGSVLIVSLGLGIFGYHYLGGLGWLDSLLNASMILSGMGPVNAIESAAGKWFASFYALFSGVIFLVIAGILVAPVAHRLLHHVHLDGEEDKEKT